MIKLDTIDKSIIGLGSFLFIFSGTMIYQDTKTNYLYKEIEKKIDKNKDGFVSHQEWKNVYSFFEKSYDIHTSNPKKDLGISNMKEYIQNK